MIAGSIRTGAMPNTLGARGLDIVRVLAATDVAEATGRPAFVAGSIDPVGTDLKRGAAIMTDGGSIPSVSIHLCHER